MLRRAIWTLLIFVTIGPALGGAVFIAQLTLLGLIEGSGPPNLRSITQMVPYFWAFAWVQASYARRESPARSA